MSLRSEEWKNIFDEHKESFLTNEEPYGFDRFGIPCFSGNTRQKCAFLLSLEFVRNSVTLSCFATVSKRNIAIVPLAQKTLPCLTEGQGPRGARDTLLLFEGLALGCPRHHPDALRGATLCETRSVSCTRSNCA